MKPFFTETGSPTEQNPGCGRSTAGAQDIFLCLTARRQPTITVNE